MKWRDDPKYQIFMNAAGESGPLLLTTEGTEKKLRKHFVTHESTEKTERGSQAFVSSVLS
jgi:hypothetical protein